MEEGERLVFFTLDSFKYQFILGDCPAPGSRSYLWIFFSRIITGRKVNTGRFVRRCRAENVKIKIIFLLLRVPVVTKAFFVDFLPFICLCLKFLVIRYTLFVHLLW
jgi:hypothetical protein